MQHKARPAYGPLSTINQTNKQNTKTKTKTKTKTDGFKYDASFVYVDGIYDRVSQADNFSNILKRIEYVL